MRKTIFTMVIIILLALPSNVFADVAPPPQPPGSNLEPGTENTQVRMVAETVNIIIQADTPAISLGQARVSADFTMRNLDDQDESMTVRFPLGHDEGYPSWKTIDNLVVMVNNRTTSTKIITENGDNSNLGVGSDSPWAVFDVYFPSGQDVSIQITYTLEAGGESPFVQFDYIFSTGAGWKDTIGSATLNVIFPYEINSLNVLPDYSFGKDPMSHQSGPKQLTWVFTDLEPQLSDNFELRMVAPSIWKTILKEKSNVTAKPNDGEAWGRLGKLYKQIAFSSRGRGFRSGTLNEDTGAQELFILSKDAYQKAVDLKPSDALWHAGFADLLAYYVSWISYEHIDSRSEAYKALSEIKTALELAPKDAKVLEIADSLVYELGGGLVKNGDTYDYPGLTATPNLPEVEFPVATETPARFKPTTQVSTPTLIPLVDTPAKVPTATPKTQKGLPLCGSLILLPLGLIFWITHRRMS